MLSEVRTCDLGLLQEFSINHDISLPHPCKETIYFRCRAHQVETHLRETFTICFDCGQSVSCMTRHRQRYHSTEEHQCPYCPKVLSHKSVLKIHIDASHVSTQCHDCGKVLQNKKKYKYHMMAKHTPPHLVLFSVNF